MNKVVVIGGGASGLVAAINASSKADVTILEKNNDVAKKILVTGSGKCNYFNSDINIIHYYTDDYDKLVAIISEENKKKVLDFFDRLGIVPRIRDGYYYPYSNQATAVKSMLTCEVKKRNIKVITNLEVTDLVKKGNKFIINEHKEHIVADKVIVATGSIAGTRDNHNFLLDILKRLGLKVIPVKPALVQLKGETLKNCSGVRCEAEVSLYVDSKFKGIEQGELQITDYGISGICTLNLSSIVSRNFDKDIIVKINFLPSLDKYEFINWMDERSEKLNLNIVELLESIVNYKLIFSILKKAKIDNVSWESLNREAKLKLTELLFNYPLKITGTNDFSKAQVATGGVSLKCINENTMQSDVEGLYLTGEVLNVDGKCGGFNLGFAFITGMIAGDLK